MNKTLIYAICSLCGALPLAACGEDDSGGTTAGSGGGPGAAVDGSTGGQGSTPVDGEWAGIYALDVPASYWTEPPGAGAEIGAFVPRFLFNVSGSTVTLATANDSVQDPCTPTAVVESSVTPPQFKVGPLDYQMHLVNTVNHSQVNALVRNLTIANVLPPVDDAGGTLSAVLDAREIYPLFHLVPNPQPSNVCLALESFGAPCEPCPHDGESFCLTLAAARLEAVPAPELAMTAVDAASLGAECAEVIP